jgi:hypothetical protein
VSNIEQGRSAFGFCESDAASEDIHAGSVVRSAATCVVTHRMYCADIMYYTTYKTDYHTDSTVSACVSYVVTQIALNLKFHSGT